MSAFLCSRANFIALSSWICAQAHTTSYLIARAAEAGHEVGKDTLQVAVARTLYDENVRSLRSRYGDRIPEGREVPDLAENAHTLPWTHKLGLVQLLKTCDGIEYQSCESADYRSTPAYALLDFIRGRLISLLPGYEESRWDLQESDLPATGRGSPRVLRATRGERSKIS